MSIPCACVHCNDVCMAEPGQKVCTACADEPGEMSCHDPVRCSQCGRDMNVEPHAATCSVPRYLLGIAP